MSWRRSGRRKPRTKAVRSVASGDERDSTGIEGTYLKLGKRNAEAVEGLPAAGASEVLVTRTLLKGYQSVNPG